MLPLVVHTGIAVKTWDVPATSLVVVGEMVTPVRVVAGASVIVMTAVLPLVTPLSVALTKIRTTPPVVPAVKVTWAPVVGSSVPSVLAERFHAYAIPEVGQVAVHEGTAVKS